MSCTDVQTIQAGNGTKTQFSFDFPYIFKSEIHVYFWNATTKEWDEKLTTDATYPWQVTDANPTIVEFTSTAPPSPTTPTDPGEPTVDNVRIRRITNLDDIRALFNPGSAIRSDDLNNNFEQLRYAIQESGCQGIPDDVDDYLKTYYWNNFDDTVYSTDTWDSSDSKIASTAAMDARYLDQGTDTISEAEQDAGSPAPSDVNVFSALAAAKRFDTIVQTGTPSGSAWEIGKTWLQNDSDLTLSIWNGSAWTGVASGGTFTNQPKVVYVDATSGNDANDGHRISRPKATIKAAINQINADATYGDGSVVVVAPGVYQETAPIQIQKKNVSIIGQALRSCIVHPTVATQGDQSAGNHALFELNSGSYIANLTLTGMQSNTGTGNSVDATLPTNQGWNFAFYSNATITKSPYIQNCTNFSDSEIDNSNLNANTPAGGLAGDTDSAPTGGGLLIDGSVVNSASPLRSMVCDSYTHVGLNGPGILVTNNGYAQATSSYAFFNKYHIKCLNGGQANLAASTTDFGDQALVADGKSTTSIFTSNVDGAASDNAISFNINEPTAGSGWYGDTERPATNMLVEVNSVIYPILSATANTDSEGGAGWTVTISRPNPNNRSENLGLNGAISDDAAVSFYLRSMIASSGHTMEYVGSGTDYRALPENGGVPDETKQITESNNGKVWTAITDHNGKFKIGGNQTDDPIFEVDQQLGFVTIPEGSIAFNLLSDLTPQLGGNLDVNGQTITSASNGNIVIDPDGTGNVGIGTSSPTNSLHVVRSSYQVAKLESTADNADGAYLEIYANSASPAAADTLGIVSFRGNDSGGNALTYAQVQAIIIDPTDTTESGAITFNTRNSGNFSERMRLDSSGNLGIGTSSPNKNSWAGSAVTLQCSTSGAYEISDGSTLAAAFALQGDDRIEIINFRAGPLTFKTDNTERMRIDDDGTIIFNFDGATYEAVTFSHTATYGNGTLQIQPVTIPGSGTSQFYTHFADKVGVGTTKHNVVIDGSLSKGSGSFRIPHPLKPETHELVHSFIEGPQADLIYRGHIQLVNGAATVNIDEAGRMSEGTFEALCTNVCCFTSNESDWTAVRGSVSGNILTIEAQDSTSTAEVCWMVVGERKDQHMIETDWTDENGRVITEPLKHQ